MRVRLTAAVEAMAATNIRMDEDNFILFVVVLIGNVVEK